MIPKSTTEITEVRARHQGYRIVLEPGPNNWSAFSPDIPGCIATGPDLQATLTNFIDAMRFHFEGLAADGKPIPLPRQHNPHS